MTFDPSAIPSPYTLEALAGIELVDESGVRLKAGSLWEQNKTAVIWIRHFNCGMCQSYLAALGDQVKPEDVEKVGVKIAVIGCGEAKNIKAYRKLLSFAWPIYADPKAKTYSTLNMVRTLQGGPTKPVYLKGSGVNRTFGSIGNAFKMGSVTGGGNIKQNGGELVLGPGNTCSFAHRMPHARGHTEVPDLMKELGVATIPPSQLWRKAPWHCEENANDMCE